MRFLQEEMKPGKENGSGGDPGGYAYKQSSGYALSGKIMLSAIIILFTVVILIVCLHIYARWFLLRPSRRQHTRRSRRRRARHTRIVFSIDPANSDFVAQRGLDESVLKSLSTFVYSSASHGDEVLECSVCLSEFEDDEKGRLLPKCNHSFHIDCIDMWFHSHSTCPLCRTLVTSEIPPANPNATPVEVAVTVVEPEPGPSSGLCPSSHHDEFETGSSSLSSSSSSPPSSSAASSSLGTREKASEAVTISIEVPLRNDTLRSLEEQQLCLGSPGVQGLKSPLKSPGGRIQSLKRIFSRERKGSVSPSSATGLSCSTTTEIDLENGDEHRIQGQPK